MIHSATAAMVAEMPLESLPYVVLTSQPRLDLTLVVGGIRSLTRDELGAPQGR